MKNYIPRKVVPVLVFGRWNYDYLTNTYRIRDHFGIDKHLVVSPEGAMEIGVIIMDDGSYQTRIGREDE